jgi:sulfur-carrier protein adenylyltransferase/sulfurtransferase
MKTITVQQLKEMMTNGEDFQLVDVREDYEYDIANIGGELIPLGQIPNYADKISKDRKVVVHCRSGVRSARAIEFLEENNGFDNLYNLEGGILAWAEQIDASVPKY